MENNIFDFVIIGGGAAGFFAAIQAAEHNPELKILILEGTRKVLTKVRVSGGGRCNVTHHCFEAKELAKNYPRGEKELLQAFSYFQPKNTIEWYKRNGVDLHVEKDGRMFPTTHSSQTIIDCLMQRIAELNIELRLGQLVKSISKNTEIFKIEVQKAEMVRAKKVMIATGSFPGGYELARSLGHNIVDLVPSLFTFVVTDKRLMDCSGVSFEKVNCKLVADGKTFKQTGPMLITHWGLSGPCILKLSAWAARELFRTHYNGTLYVELLEEREEDLKNVLDDYKKQHGLRTVINYSPFALPLRFWEKIVLFAGGHAELRYAEMKKEVRDALVKQLKNAEFKVSGKGEFKDEFVTCGGVARKEIDFKTFQSRLCPGLYFAGEVIDIDGITGGFNFQNAWTGGYLAGRSVAVNETSKS